MGMPQVRHVSECFVKPKHIPEASKQLYHLSHWDLVMLSVQYIQKGLMFQKPPEAYQQHDFMKSLLQKLQHSLSHTLVHFYPLAGRLVTLKGQKPGSCSVAVDCINSPGARFIYSALEMTVSDILSPKYVPVVVQSLFDHDRAANHDGHEQSLLSVQVTELVDGVFIGLSMNHSLGDGTSFWHFFNSWSEIFMSQQSYNTDAQNAIAISRPPVLEPWFPDGYVPPLTLPFNHPDEFIRKYESPVLKERMFHFSSESIAKLKSNANQDSNATTTISSFQSLSALMWRCITRARDLPLDQVTSCRLAADCRSRLTPPLSRNYFGNSIATIPAVAKAGELLEREFSWAATKVHEAVINLTDEAVRETVNRWVKSPVVYHIDRLFDQDSIMMGSSPRFDKYGNEFGMGKPIGLRSGYAHKFDGKISAYPGREGDGSIDLEICLLPEFMDALESDSEFMSVVSP